MSCSTCCRQKLLIPIYQEVNDQLWSSTCCDEEIVRASSNASLPKQHFHLRIKQKKNNFSLLDEILIYLYVTFRVNSHDFLVDFFLMSINFFANDRENIPNDSIGYKFIGNFHQQMNVHGMHICLMNTFRK